MKPRCESVQEVVWRRTSASLTGRCPLFALDDSINPKTRSEAPAAQTVGAALTDQTPASVWTASFLFGVTNALTDRSAIKTEHLLERHDWRYGLNAGRMLWTKPGRRSAP